MIDDPTVLSRHRAGVRPHDHKERRDGATRDPGAIQAFISSAAARRQDQKRSALRVGKDHRGYSYQDHERAQALRETAKLLHERADAANAAAAEQRGDRETRGKLEHESSKLRAQAVALEQQADHVVPVEYSSQ